MKIYKNLWVGYECYFVKIGSAWSDKNEPAKSKTVNVRFWDGKWKVDMGAIYNTSLKDEKYYPIVGEIDLKRIIVDSILSAVKSD